MRGACEGVMGVVATRLWELQTWARAGQGPKRASPGRCPHSHQPGPAHFPTPILSLNLPAHKCPLSAGGSPRGWLEGQFLARLG